MLAQNYSPPQNNDKASDGNILRSFILFSSVQTIFWFFFFGFSCFRSILRSLIFGWCTSSFCCWFGWINVAIRIYAEDGILFQFHQSPFIFELSDKLLCLARGFEWHAKRKHSASTVISKVGSMSAHSNWKWYSTFNQICTITSEL